MTHIPWEGCIKIRAGCQEKLIRVQQEKKRFYGNYWQQITM